MSRTVTDPDALKKRFPFIDSAGLRKVTDIFRFRATPYYLSLIEQPGDPIYRQCIPDVRELEADSDLLNDPLGEETHAPVECLVHRYPDHCLLLVSDQCAMYCRFCTRKRKFRTPMCVDKEHLDAAFSYIREHDEIHDVLISGGDPFLLTDDRIEYILQNVRAIKHVDIIRIGTRTPCVLPERITRKLTSMLKKYHPLYINVHFNHPREVTPEAASALGRLADAGIPLGSQTVLLKGVNDNPQVMRELMQKLLAARVRPYYIFFSDLVYGTEHFRVPVAKGIEIIDKIRGWTSGLAVPHLAIDLPCGGGKITLVPQYLQEKQGRNLIFRNYRGDRYVYPDADEPEEK